MTRFSTRTSCDNIQRIQVAAIFSGIYYLQATMWRLKKHSSASSPNLLMGSFSFTYLATPMIFFNVQNGAEMIGTP